MTGIYKITNPFNQVYIGQSLDIDKRFNQHKQGHNSNSHLTLSIKKHGFDAHECEILELCSKEDLTSKERYYLSVYKKDFLLFNYSIYLFHLEHCFNLINISDYGITEIIKIKAKKDLEKQLNLKKTTQIVEIMLEIKKLYGQLKDKKAFCEMISKETGTGARTIYNHWFGGFWSIPEKHQDLVLKKLLEAGI